MSMLSYFSFPALAIFSIIVALIVYLWPRVLDVALGYKYPPGPNGVPIFGNLFQLPPEYAGTKMIALAKQYGDIRWVYVNSLDTARELFDKRGKIYIGRPEFPITQDILSGGGRIVLMNNTPQWRDLRKIMHSLLMASNAKAYEPFQDTESKALVWQLLHEPSDFHKHAARFANSADSNSVFGRRTSMGEPNVRALFGTIDDFMSMVTSPLTSLPEQFPWLVRWLPGNLQWFRPKAERVFDKTMHVYASFMEDLDKRVAAGEDPQCFARDMFKLADRYQLDQVRKYFYAGSMIEAGSDTTRNQINLMLAAAAIYPAWVRTAQAELHSVCGAAERLPTFEDWDRLPYIVATIKETLRWRPNMTTTGTPRRLVDDDTFRGYKFEKGTIFPFNNAAISHNENDFKRNGEFLPERFLNIDLQDMLKGHAGFGFGRRACPGWYVGTRNMFIAFARILYCFDIKERPGHKIDPLRIDAFAHEHAPFDI
ncbi:cytochrome P450 [Elsinoe ampelina]|uniref:Cytochrome P450 n=1 Tax=Elsinoe ampelina TaxID=302913 RepID=A0A6A6GPF0_9PEZI|nr:cytochrome P450 [Elsinoe ampelina]